MIKKVLIANRGEIACRIARTAHRLGVKTAGVYSDVDKDANHVHICGQSYLIGPPQPAQSYLMIDHILESARFAKAQAIHPGYGFLSENAEFVEQCDKKDIVFIGPPVEAIKAMGSKSESKTIMDKAKVPILPGYHGEN